MAEREVVIPYSPRPWALDFHRNAKRWSILVIHRRAGKTTAALNHLQRDALSNEGSFYGYIAPTYKQAKLIAWDVLKQYSRVIPQIEYNESELTIKYPNGSRIRLFGADNPDSLRGIGLWGVVFDEYSQQPSNIFTEIIRPALSDHHGYAIWIGTPKGKNDFYRLYERGRQDEDWYARLLTAYDTGILSPEELRDARKVMTEEEYNQEFLCSFDASIRGAYYASELQKARLDGRIKPSIYDASLLVHTVWDLGIGDPMSIGFYQKLGTELRMIDYYESNDKPLKHYVEVLQQKTYKYGRHFAPHDIAVRELSSGKSRLEMAKALGISFEITPNLPVDDGINAARLMFERLWIDETNCAFFLDAIAQYQRERNYKAGMFKEKPLHDWTSHAADVHRYAALVENQMKNQTFSPPSTTGLVQPYYPGLGV